MVELEQKIKTLRSLISLNQVPETVSSDLSRQLSRIEKRRKDDNVYIGIVGEFSSGKSTLINSLIGADFFVTNSLQGTTTTPTFIKFGKSINLAVNYKNGKTLKYSSSKKELLNDFLPSYKEKLTAKEKLVLIIKGILHANTYDQTLIELFETVTTSNEASAIIDSVVIYYPAEILKNGIVIVDTPGTDSLNPLHTITTKNTITNVCDMAFVIIPSERPVSQTLVNFIEDNFSEEIKLRCYFLVTKIELIKRHIERQSHINGISKLLCAKIDLKNAPKVYMAPTLASLEYRNIIKPSGLLEHLDVNECSMLTHEFEKDILQITKEIEITKNEAIKEKISLMVHTLNRLFHESLNEAKSEKEEELSTLKKLQTMPLSDFMNSFFRQHDFTQLYNTAEAKVSNAIMDERNSFKSHVFFKIDYADTKDEAQGVMSSESIREYGQAGFEDCFKTFTETVEWLKGYYENSFEDFKTAFTETFAISAIDFTFTAKINESWNKRYHFNFDDTNITTTKIFRFFKSLESVKTQMKEAVEPQINNAFGKISSHYIKKIKKIDKDLNKQLEKVKSLFVSKYEKIIQQRISDEKKKMILLSNQVAELETSLKTLSSILE